jgi:bifunctional non-homologous end joining protein LigD
MLAKPGPMPRDQQQWGFEFKWDGVRTIVFCHGGKLRLESRNRLDITPRYPELVGLADVLADAAPVVLDGEIIALDEKGLPSFEKLQPRMHVQNAGRIAKLATQVPVILMIFDVLHIRGRDVTALPYQRRRELLDELGLGAAHWHVPPWRAGEGEAMVEAARQTRLEGVVAKRLDSTYQPGRRSGAWIKIKLVRSQEFVIGGYLHGAGALEGMLGSLLLGVYDEAGQLCYAGRVGTGFTDARRETLKAILDGLACRQSPFDRGKVPGGATFARPKLVAQVEFTEWTSEGRIRHPSFKGLRDDKAPGEVVREDV